MSDATAVAPVPARPARTTFPCFDGLRAIAAVTVVLHHASFPTGRMINGHGAHYFTHLDVGVAVFFLISGFLLYRPFVAARLDGRPGPSIRRFFKRRLLRIYPAYWLALVGIIIFFGLPVPVHGALSYIEYFTLFQIYDNLTRASGGISQAWTLSVELSFYAFLPLYAWLIGRVGTTRPARTQVGIEAAGLAALYAISLAFRAMVFALHSGRVHALGIYWLPANLDYFALGMGLAVASAWFVDPRPVPAIVERVVRYPVLPWLASALCFYVVSRRINLPVGLVRIDGKRGFARQFLYGATAFFLLLPAVFGRQDQGLVRRLLRWKPVAFVGIVSYGVYLWHQAWVEKAVKWQGRPVFQASFPAVVTVALALTLVTASISWFLVEQPLLGVRDRAFRRSADVTPATERVGS